MSRLSDILQDFSTLAPSAPPAGMTEEEIESAKLESFEQGYQAGWDDAVKAHTNEQTRVSSDFAQNLQDLGFTYHEAYNHILAGMNPLLQQMVDVLLPDLTRQALGLHVTEELQAMARDLGAQEVEIVVAPPNLDAMKHLTEGDYGFPVRVVSEESLSEGQADLRFADSEKQIDLTAVLQGITEAVQGFAHENQKDVVNG